MPTADITRDVARHMLKHYCLLGDNAANTLFDAATWLYDVQGGGRWPHRLLNGLMKVLVAMSQEIDARCRLAKMVYEEISSGTINLAMRSRVLESTHGGHPYYLMEQADIVLGTATGRINELELYTQDVPNNPNISIPDPGAEGIVAIVLSFFVGSYQLAQGHMYLLRGGKTPAGRSLIMQTMHEWRKEL